MTMEQWNTRRWVLRFDELGHYLATKEGVPSNPSMQAKPRPDQSLITSFLERPRSAEVA